MAAVSAQNKRLFLRGAYRSAKDEGLPLYEKLNNLIDGRYADTSSGSQIVSTTANGKTVTFGMPARDGGWNATSSAELVEEIITRAENTAAFLGVALDGSSDEALYTQMLSDIQPVRSFSRSYESLRCQ